MKSRTLFHGIWAMVLAAALLCSAALAEGGLSDDAAETPVIRRPSGVSQTRFVIESSSVAQASYAAIDGFQLVIPDGVTSIASSAFTGCESIFAVQIPGSVAVIGEEAFSFCSHLSAVTINEGTAVIGESAFSNCPSLSAVYLPHSMKTIAKGAFANCPRLTDVYYDGTIYELGEIGIHENNDALINAEVHFIGSDELAVECRETVNADGRRLQAQYPDCEVYDLIVPEGVYPIYYLITWKDGDELIYETSLYSMVAPLFLYDPAEDAELTIVIEVVDGEGRSGKLIIPPRNSKEDIFMEVTIAAAAARVQAGDMLRWTINAAGATEPCRYSIMTEHDGVIISFEEFSAGSSYVYSYKATAIGSEKIYVTVTDKNDKIGFADSEAVWVEGSVFQTIPDGGTGCVITGYYGTDSDLTIPMQIGGLDVTAIASEAFKGNLLLESVVIEANVRSIGAGAFQDCKRLQRIDLPTSIEEIDDQAFQGCSQLEIMN